MSHENVEIVRRAYDAFNQGDLEGLLDFVDPGIEIRPDPGLPDWRVFEGREGFLSFAETWLEPWESYRIEPEELVDAGDRVMAITRESGRASETGSDVEHRVHHVWTLRERRAVRWDVFYDRTRALEAAGLEE